MFEEYYLIYGEKLKTNLMVIQSLPGNQSRKIKKQEQNIKKLVVKVDLEDAHGVKLMKLLQLVIFIQLGNMVQIE